MRRLALPLALLAPLAAFAQTTTKPIEPVLCTFGNGGVNGGAGTLLSRFPWRGTGTYVWNRVGLSSSDLLDGAGQSSGVSLSCVGSLCGTAGVLLKSQFPGREQAFPQAPVTDAEANDSVWNGGVLNNNTGFCSFTLSGLDAQGKYTLYVLAGRGNAWQNAESTYAVEGATFEYAENAQGSADLTQNTSNGNWLVFAVTFTGRESVTVSATGGAGNFNAFALEGKVPVRRQWANPQGGAWSEEANWANAALGGDPWLRDLADASGAVEIVYDADPEPAAIRYDAGSTAYVLKAGTFGAAFVDGEVVKDGPGTVTLTSAETTAAFYVAEGTLRVDGAAGLVTVAPGAALAGTGRVGALALADGAVLDAAAGALEVGALSLLQPTLLDKSLPEGETLAASATVTVRVPEGRGDGPVLAWEGALPEGLAFAVADAAGNDLSAYVEQGEGSLGLKDTAQVEAGLAGAARSAVLAAAIGAGLKGEVGLAGVDAAAANEVFGCFEGEGLCVADAAANAVAVGYAFGIADVRLEGAEAVVTVRVGDRAGGAGPTFVEGAAVRLTRGGETLASAEAPAGAAEVTLRVEASALGGGVAAEAFAPVAAAGE